MKDLLKIFMGILILGMVFPESCKKDEEPDQDGKTTVVSLLPDTGQSASFTSTAGEDSDYTINSPSFTDNLNSTITDNITGLMWQKSDGGEMTFENAIAYCDQLIVAGFDDWRLPTGSELFSVNHYEKSNPALNTAFFTQTAAEYWWSSEKRADDPSKVWVVNAGGGIGAHPKSETVSAGGTKRMHVRAVRNISAPAAKTDHFTDNGDGTVKDNYTGLVWQKHQASALMSWEEALVHSEGLVLAGFDDWRMPNIKEIQSLNDAALCKPSFNRSFFPDISSGVYWSSTTLVNAPAKAWTINVDYGIVSYTEKIQNGKVICVRGGQ
jgi:hypothetical protein